MNENKFREHLEQSIPILFELTGQYCLNELSESVKFIIEPSGGGVHAGMTEANRMKLWIYNEMGTKEFTMDETIDLLFSGDKVPLWINMSVRESRTDLTLIHLLISRRSGDDLQMNYKAEKYPPFHIQVALPPGYPDRREKFDINWQKERRTL